MINKFTKRQAKSQADMKGFTIVELMVALGVMSLVLIMSTTILIQIGSIYNRGVSSSNMQNTSRSIVSDISSAIEFSGYNPAVSECSGTADTSGLNNSCYSNGSSSDPYPSESAYCIGTVRYTFIPNVELGLDIATNPITHLTNATTPHILWRDLLKSYSDPCQPVNLAMTNPIDGYSVPNSGAELMAYHTRLTSFSVTAPSTDDPLTGKSNVYNVNVSAAYGDSDLLNLSGAGTTCNSQVTNTSSEFCSTTSITTTVNARVY
jgi:type II secretory pathway pseudopilin PulG